MTINTYQLTEPQLINLREFMQRVDLKGAEVKAFSELIDIFFPQPVQEESKQK